jgi:hypothetical protein
MNSRQRVIEAINHRKPDRIPVDLGGTAVSGISATAYHRLRQRLGLETRPVRILEMLQFVADVDDDVRERLGIDIKALPYPVDTLGNLNKGYKTFTSPTGIQAAVSDASAWDVLDDHSIVLYAQGDRDFPPSARMLGDGMYFDNITSRIPRFDEDDLHPLEDFKDDFSLIGDEIAEILDRESEKAYADTEYAICGIFPMALLGDAGISPAPFLKEPRGIRKMEDWLMAHILHPEYIRAVFELQTEMALRNLEIYRQAVGERIQIVFMSSADYGNQNSEMISPGIFRDLYKPFYRRMNDWVHANTGWKTFYHSCGSIVNLLDDYVDMGADIINPLQLSARGMDGKTLQGKYQHRLVFWGGGVDTQATLAFGTPDDVRREALERLELFSKDGGYIFNPVHNIVANTDIDNVLSLFDAVKEFDKDRR